MEIQESNRLIAEFMGGKFHKQPQHNHMLKITPQGMPVNIDGEHFFSEDNLLYNTSWDWLMPVVEKIEKDGAYCVDTIQERCWITMLDFSKPLYGKKEARATTKIEAVYNSVIEFISYFNKNQQ